MATNKTKAADAARNAEDAAESAAAPAADAAAPSAEISDAEVDRQIDAGIANAVAGRRSVPTRLKVRSTREGHRRAGRAWSTAAMDVAIADFTPAQLEQLLGDPTLIVESI